MTELGFTCWCLHCGFSMENNSDDINYFFFNRLKDYPHYCQHLASIPHFMEFPPSLIEFIEYGQQSREPLLAGRNIQVNKLNVFY